MSHGSEITGRDIILFPTSMGTDGRTRTCYCCVGGVKAWVVDVESESKGDPLSGSKGCLNSTLRSHSNIRSRSKPSSLPLILRGEYEHQDQRLI